MDWDPADVDPAVQALAIVVTVVALYFFGWLEVADKWTRYAARIAVVIAVTFTAVGVTLLFVNAHQR